MRSFTKGFSSFIIVVVVIIIIIISSSISIDVAVLEGLQV